MANFDIEKCIGTISVRNKRIKVPSLKKTYKLNQQNRYKIYKKIDFIIEEIKEQVFYNTNQNEIEDELSKEIREIILKKIYKMKLFNTFLNMENDADILVKNNISYDDIPTYAFIEMSIKGFPVDNTIKQLFIDETVH